MDFAEAILAFFALLGTVAFAISGAMIAIEKNVDLFGVAFLGLTTAMGGGMLRDLLLREIPVIFRRHIYALASILGAGVYLALCRWGCAEVTAAFAGVAATFLLRMAATHFDWNLPRAFPDGEKGDWRTPDDPV